MLSNHIFCIILLMVYLHSHCVFLIDSSLLSRIRTPIDKYDRISPEDIKEQVKAKVNLITPKNIVKNYHRSVTQVSEHVIEMPNESYVQEQGAKTLAGSEIRTMSTENSNYFVYLKTRKLLPDSQHCTTEKNTFSETVYHKIPQGNREMAIARNEGKDVEFYNAPIFISGFEGRKPVNVSKLGLYVSPSISSSPTTYPVKEIFYRYIAKTSSPLIENVIRYEPIDFSLSSDNINQYSPDKILPRNMNKYQFITNTFVPSTEIIIQFEKNPLGRYLSRTASPVHTFIYQYKTNAPPINEYNRYTIKHIDTSLNDIYRYQPDAMSTILDYIYRHRTATDLSTENILRYEPIDIVLPSEKSFNQKTVKASPLIDNKYRYETVGSVWGGLPDVYHIELLSTFQTPGATKQYEPLKFSALYLDDTTWIKRYTVKLPITTNAYNESKRDGFNQRSYIENTELLNLNQANSTQFLQNNRNISLNTLTNRIIWRNPVKSSKIYEIYVDTLGFDRAVFNTGLDRSTKAVFSTILSEGPKIYELHANNVSEILNYNNNKPLETMKNDISANKIAYFILHTNSTKEFDYINLHTNSTKEFDYINAFNKTTTNVDYGIWINPVKRDTLQEFYGANLTTVFVNHTSSPINIHSHREWIYQHGFTETLDNLNPFIKRGLLINPGKYSEGKSSSFKVFDQANTSSTSLADISTYNVANIFTKTRVNNSVKNSSLFRTIEIKLNSSTLNPLTIAKTDKTTNISAAHGISGRYSKISNKVPKSEYQKERLEYYDLLNTYTNIINNAHFPTSEVTEKPSTIFRHTKELLNAAQKNDRVENFGQSLVPEHVKILDKILIFEPSGAPNRFLYPKTPATTSHQYRILKQYGFSENTPQRITQEHIDLRYDGITNAIDIDMPVTINRIDGVKTSTGINIFGVLTVTGTFRKNEGSRYTIRPKTYSSVINFPYFMTPVSSKKLWYILKKIATSKSANPEIRFTGFFFPARYSKTYDSLFVFTKQNTHKKPVPYSKFTKEAKNIILMDSEITTRAPDDYWRDFLQIKPHGIVTENIYRIVPWTPDTKLDEWQEFLKSKLYLSSTAAYNIIKPFSADKTYHMRPLTITRVPADYWNEFLSQEPRIFQDKTKPYQVSKRGTIPDNSIISNIYTEWFITPNSFDQPQQILTQEKVSNEPIDDSTVMENSQDVASLGVSVLMNQQPSHTIHNLNFKKEILNSRVDYEYVTEYLRSTQSLDNLYYEDAVKNLSNEPVKPSPTRMENKNFLFELSSFVTDVISPSREYQGFETLWKPTLTTQEMTLKPTLISFTKPLSSKLKHWNFNDEDAAWPKVEIILSTTEKSTALIKSTKSLLPYFPYFMRTVDTSVKTTTTTAANTTTELLTSPEIQISETDEVTSTESLADADSLDTELRQSGSTRCYMCGLNQSGIPDHPTCHHIFNPDDGTYVSTRSRCRTICSSTSTKTPREWVPEKPLTLFKGGCFKRFLDIGETYDERGCRTYPPLIGLSFASRRFARLEIELLELDEGCTVSPHASLTPFSRGISLFARYHACVCKGRYCNDAQSNQINVILIFINAFLSI